MPVACRPATASPCVALASGLEIGVVLFTVDEGLEACRANDD